MPDTFRPKLYLLHGCPFCMKTALFLGEADLLDGIDIVGLPRDSAEEGAARETLSPHFEKVSYPSIEYAAGQYMNESDKIIGHYAEKAGVDKGGLKAFNFYVSTFMPRIGELYRENMELKKAQAAA